MIYDASEAVDREFLSRLEALHNDCEDRFDIVRIDTYKSDRIACMLDYDTSPSLFVMVDGQAKEYHTDLSALDDKVRAAVEKYADAGRDLMRLPASRRAGSVRREVSEADPSDRLTHYRKSVRTFLRRSVNWS